jgi:hypothetical protein
MVQGHYGEFKIQVDGNTIIDGGALAVLGVLPSGGAILAAVKDRLAA